jgi:hypothetical protein
VTTHRLSPAVFLADRNPANRPALLLATIAVLFFGLSPSGISQLLSVPPTGPFNWKSLEVRIIARGSTATSSTGNMDAYLAIISRKGGRDQSIARLVHYYPSFEPGLRNDQIVSGRIFHLRLSSAGYCSMPLKDFVVQRVFDFETVNTLRDRSNQDPLPCFILHE